MRRIPAIVLAAAFLAAGGALLFVAARGSEAPATAQQRMERVASTIRCPVCRDLSVADSPSLVAREMRATIERRLRAGETDDEIRDYFVSRYGESILLTPKAGGIDLLVWILPALLVAAGIGAVVLAVRRWTRPAPVMPPPSEDDRRLVEGELGAFEEGAGWA